VRRTRWVAQGHSIAPTEFPKARSAAGVIGPRDRHTPLHAPFRWRVPIPGHALRRLPARASPRGSFGMVAISQPSTDHRDVPASLGQRDFCSPRQACERSQLLGPTRCEQERGITSPPIDALTRVDVACRYMGNEVGW
jgi:hypothetical protein